MVNTAGSPNSDSDVTSSEVLFCSSGCCPTQSEKELHLLGYDLETDTTRLDKKKKKDEEPMYWPIHCHVKLVLLLTLSPSLPESSPRWKVAARQARAQPTCRGSR